MESIKAISKETSFLLDPYSRGMNKKTFDYLIESYTSSERQRHRVCFHQNTKVDLHDIIIAYDKQTYIPPNKHVGKPETIMLLKGELEVYIFNDNGLCVNAIKLSAEDKGYPFLLRMPPNTWHGLRCISEGPCIVKETITGPYDSKSLQLAEFAPSEKINAETNQGFQYYERLSSQNAQELSKPKRSEYTQINECVLQSCDQFPVVNREVVVKLKEMAEKTELQRARLCLHPNTNDSLQEMIIYLTGSCDIDVSYHINKDESLAVIEGEGRHDFYSDDNKVYSSYRLANFKTMLKRGSDFRCFTRINRFVPHKIIPSSEGVAIYEATTGPFHREDTQYLLEEI